LQLRAADLDSEVHFPLSAAELPGPAQSRQAEDSDPQCLDFVL